MGLVLGPAAHAPGDEHAGGHGEADHAAERHRERGHRGLGRRGRQGVTDGDQRPGRGPARPRDEVGREAVRDRRRQRGVAVARGDRQLRAPLLGAGVRLGEDRVGVPGDAEGGGHPGDGVGRDGDGREGRRQQRPSTQGVELVGALPARERDHERGGRGVRRRAHGAPQGPDRDADRQARDEDAERDGRGRPRTRKRPRAHGLSLRWAGRDTPPERGARAPLIAKRCRRAPRTGPASVDSRRAGIPCGRDGARGGPEGAMAAGHGHRHRLESGAVGRRGGRQRARPVPSGGRRRGRRRRLDRRHPGRPGALRGQPAGPGHPSRAEPGRDGRQEHRPRGAGRSLGDVLLPRQRRHAAARRHRVARGGLRPAGRPVVAGPGLVPRRPRRRHDRRHRAARGNRHLRRRAVRPVHRRLPAPRPARPPGRAAVRGARLGRRGLGVVARPP